MALLSALFAHAGQLAERLLNTVFGWATAALFGRALDRGRATLLSLIALAAVVWLAAAVGVLVLGIGAFLLAPEGVGGHWARLGMTALVGAVPAIVGVLSLFLFPRAQRPRGRAAVRTVVLGYPYTIGLALTLVLLVLFLPLLTLRNLTRRWADTHIPVQARPGAYPSVVRTVHEVLHDAGYHVAETAPPALLRLPYALLGLFGRGSLGALLAERLTLLRGDDLEVLLYPSDLVLSSGRQEQTRARAVLARGLGFSDAYLSWTADGHALEDRLLAVWHRRQTAESSAAERERALFEVEQVRRDLQTANLSAGEWEVLERLCLMAEVAFLCAGAPGTVAAPAAVLKPPPAPRAMRVIQHPQAQPAPAPGPAPVAARSGINPAAVLATLAAAVVVLWRMNADQPHAEALGEG